MSIKDEFGKAFEVEFPKDVFQHYTLSEMDIALWAAKWALEKAADNANRWTPEAGYYDEKANPLEVAQVIRDEIRLMAKELSCENPQK